MSQIDQIKLEQLQSAFPFLANTPVVREAFERAHSAYPRFLFNHAVRSWVFAVSIGHKAGIAFDDEVVAVSTLLHDLGLTAEFDAPFRFEVNGANAARSFASAQGFDERRSQLVWDAVALHATPSIAIYKEVDVALAVRGVGTDFGRTDYGSFTEPEMSDIVKHLPRLNMKEEFKGCICSLASERAEVNDSNLVREFGERFVPGYRSQSVVDLIMGGPFTE